MIIPVGTSDFAEIRRENYYFVDKSAMIEELLDVRGTKVTLITRPWRFGKTLGMSMLAEFFDIQKDSGALFRGLHIAECDELCETWMNRYPTLFLSFRSVDGLEFSAAYSQLMSVIAELYKKHLYLLEGDTMNRYDKEIFDRIAAEKASLKEVKNSLLKLTQWMEGYYGAQVILLLDEYDVPLAKAGEKGYYAEMLDTVKGILQVIKDNSALKFAVITGCLKIAKESIFTGTNNFVSDTISDTRLNEFFGFTQGEVDRLLREAQLEEDAAEIREWYDGYHFGNADIYCPWDVMNYVRDLLLVPETRPSGYWKNSSDNAVIRSFLDFAGEAVTKKLEILLSGGTVVQKLKDDLTYDCLNSSEENLWSILYLTGYLTRAEGAGTALLQGRSALRIPNAEIMEIFESSIKVWFEECARQWDRRSLFEAVWSGDAGKTEKEISWLLRKTISYHDYREDFYHAFLAGIFAGAGYAVESNRESGEGRSDIAVIDYALDRAAIFKVKYAKKPAGLAGACEQAVAQINDRGYRERYEEECGTILCYGAAFCKKRCMVLKG